MPISMAEAGAERERERERKESRAMPLRERVENGEGETLRFGGSEERAVTVDKKVPEEEENGETTVGSGIVIAQLRSLPCAVRPRTYNFLMNIRGIHYRFFFRERTNIFFKVSPISLNR